MTEKKALGILGGMGPLATADLLHKVISLTDAACDNEHIRIYVDNNASIPDRTSAILSGGADPVPAMADSLRKLESCGASCIIMPCNTAHYFLPQLQTMTDVPILNMLEETAAVCARQFPGKRAGVLATKGTLAAGLYQKALEKEDVAYELPNEEERDALMRVIYDGVKAGAEPKDYAEDFLHVIRAMTARGADYFILGCTELPVAAQALRVSAPCVDPTEVLARAAISFCGYPIKK